VKDGKPDLITFQLKDGTYVIPTVVDKGYLEIGKHKLEFQRKAQTGVPADRSSSVGWE
jgi:type IV secretion system protein VirB9